MELGLKLRLPSFQTPCSFSELPFKCPSLPALGAQTDVGGAPVEAATKGQTRY